MKPYSVHLRGQDLLLLPERAVFWKSESLLILTDLHLGKVGHFRKAGIPIPKLLEQEDLALLSDLIRTYEPQTLLLLGDFFHSDWNQDWGWVHLWRDQFPDLEIILVKGNHDRISLPEFEKLDIKYFPQQFILQPFLFTHEPPTELYGPYPINFNQNGSSPKIDIMNETLYSISGHIHPAIIIKGMGHQSRRLPCFYFEERFGILPAFGKFTGTHSLKHKKNASIFVISGSSVLPFNIDKAFCV